MLSLVRNASPYWGIEYVPKMNMQKGGGLTGILSAILGAVDIAQKSSLPDNILRKVSRITWKDMFYEASTASFTVTNLTVDEASDQVFQQGSCFQISLGWWDWWCTGRFSRKVFEGSIQKTDVRYEQGGITITVTLASLGGQAISEGVNPAAAPLNLHEAKNLKTALQNIAGYIGCSLAIRLSESIIPDPQTMMTLMQESSAKPWCVPPMVPSNSPGLYPPSSSEKKKNLSSKMVRPTIRFILNEVAQRYGMVWNISDSILYFGVDLRPKMGIEALGKVFKTYSYRSAHRDFLIQVSHLQYSTFDSAEIVEGSTQSTGSSAPLTVNPTTRMATNGSQRGDGQTYPPKSIKVYGTRDSTQALPDDVRGVMNKAQDGVTNTEANMTPDMDTAIDMPQGPVEESALIPGMTTGEDVMQTKGRATSGKNQNQRMLKINGAYGDPSFRAGDIFLFNGAFKHTGFYKAVEIEHTMDVNSSYKMTVTGGMKAAGLSDPSAQGAGKVLLTKTAEKKVGAEEEAARGNILIYNSRTSTWTRDKQQITTLSQ